MNINTANSEIERFKNYLRKIGSGENTGQSISRKEAADAMYLMLTEKATPAQIGAFMIAHRIRRPEPAELAGMLDTYLALGPRIQSEKAQKRPICFCMPFDGRIKTSPIYPITTLILISEGQPVILQGGKRMPVKYGVTTQELFNELGLSLIDLNIQAVQEGYNKNGFAFIYQTDHFKIADQLIKYRDEIGKRPTLASMELLWTAHQGDHLLISGFVHPPTEERASQTLKLLNEENFIFIKGLEGGIDLPITRTCITSEIKGCLFNRHKLRPKAYNCHGKDLEWNNLIDWKENVLKALQYEGPLIKPIIWNAGVYLWFAGITPTIESGIEKANNNLKSGATKATLMKLIQWRQTK